MLFNSYLFIAGFLPVALLGFWGLARHHRLAAAELWLIGASLAFYGWWNLAYVPLIFASIGFNFMLGEWLRKRHVPAVPAQPFAMRAGLASGVAANLAVLVFFKYYNFLATNVGAATGTAIALLDVALPLGISFITFQKIAYLVDAFRGETTACGLRRYSLFVLFFPQLIAGPIVHHREIIAQFSSLRTYVANPRNAAIGLSLFALGLFKKVVVADNLAPKVAVGFDVAQRLDLLQAWETSLAYTMQLYFDFSGYSDMALGLALLFNVRLPVNFNSPYRATSIQDFWLRWHMTLSRFLRDYVYVPLGGNRGGAWLTYRNLLITFMLGGIWHGAGWTFLAWGLLHGLATVVHRAWAGLKRPLPGWLAWTLTFLFVHVAWVFFRAHSLADAQKVLGAMVGLGAAHNIELPGLHRLPAGAGPGAWLAVGGGLVLTLMAIQWLARRPNSNALVATLEPTWPRLAWAFALGAAALINLSGTSEFLYFAF